MSDYLNLEMNPPTPEEIEGARHEFWIISGGRDDAEARNEVQARLALGELKAQGWRILEVELEAKPRPFHDLRAVVATIRKGTQARVIRWYSNGWFEASPGGGDSRAFDLEPLKGRAEREARRAALEADGLADLFN